MKTMPNSGRLSALAASKNRSQTPSLDQRMKIWAAIHQGPSSAGSARHLAPFACRHRIALMVRRRSDGGTLACGRQDSTKGSSTAHCASVNIIGRLLQPKQGKRPITPRVQTLTDPNRVCLFRLDRLDGLNDAWQADLIQC